MKGRARVLRSIALRQAERDIQRLAFGDWLAHKPPAEIPPLSPLVYALADPRNGDVFYIGKGGKERLKAHERDARSGLTTPKAVRIREILLAGMHPEFRTIALCRDLRHALDVERELINEMADVLTNDRPPAPWP